MQKLMISNFVKWLPTIVGQGYIMGSLGENPKTLSTWYFEQYADRKQYTKAQNEKALYWLSHSQQVFDCAGIVEYYVYTNLGLAKSAINTKARYIYRDWCSVKDDTISTIPKQPGVAVFIHSPSKGYITHIGYLTRPVKADESNGDWIVTEARGVTYGVVETKLSARGWNRWGLMDKYFEYSTAAKPTNEPVPTNVNTGDRPTLKKNSRGEGVVLLQTALIDRGYDVGKYGADGDFGSCTLSAVKAFQEDHNLVVDGIVGAKTWSALMAQYDVEDSNIPAYTERAVVTGGSVYVRSLPSPIGKIIGIVHRNDTIQLNGLYIWDEANEKIAWYGIVYNDRECYISAKYVKSK